jgi:hypothetical protein
MNTSLQTGGRSIEEFLGRSARGDFHEALHAALREAKLTLGSDSIRWEMIHLSGISTAGSPDNLVITIKARRSTD